MNCEKVARTISDWLEKKIRESKAKGFIVGVSGGVDSALVSTLCAHTGYPTYLIELPINRKEGEISERAKKHCEKLQHGYSSVQHYKHDLSLAYNKFVESIGFLETKELPLANLSSRLRMCSLYFFANTFNGLVVGTGNKIEDFAIGFFTKYGDGGVDISPIGDLTKSEVMELAEFLLVDSEIVNAVPTDELWLDVRSDESAIGATYNELEWAINFHSEWKRYIEFPSHAELTVMDYIEQRYDNPHRHKKVMEIYLTRHLINAHKMEMPPICDLGDKN